MTCGLTSNFADLDDLIQGGGQASAGFGGGRVAARACGRCGHLRFPSIDADELRTYYETTWRENAKSWYTVENDFATWRRGPRADRVLSLVEPFGHEIDAVFHEVGCAFGGTVFELQARGLAASGTDWDDIAIAAGQSWGVRETAAAEACDRLRGSSIEPDVVYGFHWLDRLDDPVGRVRDLAGVLAERGVMAFVVPNGMAIHPLVYGYARYPWFDYPSHLHVFTARSLACLAEAAGVEVVHIASRCYDVEPIQTNRALAARSDSDIAQSLRQRAIEAALLGEELEVVFASKETAEAFPDQATWARETCRRNAAFEMDQRQRAVWAHLPDPWATNGVRAIDPSTSS